MVHHLYIIAFYVSFLHTHICRSQRHFPLNIYIFLPVRMNSSDVKEDDDETSADDSDENEIDGGEQEFSVGKYKGKTFKWVRLHHPDYCSWALRQLNPREGLFHFTEYLRLIRTLRAQPTPITSTTAHTAKFVELVETLTKLEQDLTKGQKDLREAQSVCLNMRKEVDFKARC